MLGEPIDKEAVTELENRLLNEEEQLEKLEHEAQQQAEQVRYMEDYWKKLEQTYEIREKNASVAGFSGGRDADVSG